MATPAPRRPRGGGGGGTPRPPQEKVEFDELVKIPSEGKLQVRVFCTRGDEVLEGKIDWFVGMTAKGDGDITNGYAEKEFTVDDFPEDTNSVKIVAQVQGRAARAAKVVDITDLRPRPKVATVGPDDIVVSTNYVGDQGTCHLHGLVTAGGQPAASHHLTAYGAAGGPLNVTTNEHGRFDATVTVPKDTAINFAVYPGLALRVPVVGPDQPATTGSAQPRKGVLGRCRRGWEKINNWVLLLATLFLLLTLFRFAQDFIYRIFVDGPMGTPTVQQKAPDKHKAEDSGYKSNPYLKPAESEPAPEPQPADPSEPSSSQDQDSAQPVQVSGFWSEIWHRIILGHRDPSDFFVLLFTPLYFLFYLVLAVACLYDEVVDLVEKGARTARGLTRKRQSGHYRATLAPRPEGPGATTIYFVNGEQVDATTPKPKESKGWSTAGFVGRVLTIDALVELALKIVPMAIKHLLDWSMGKR